jgi:hypothetical protein
LGAALQTVRESNPELADTLGANAQTLLENGVKFWAFDLASAAGQSSFATNLTITRQVLPNGVSFETFLTVNLDQLNALSTRNSDIVAESTTLAGLPAERVRYLLALKADPGAPVTAAITQYLVINGRNAYVLTFATRTDLSDKYRPLFDQSASSLRFLSQ